MKAAWHALAGVLPESRLLASVAEFTHHRDIDALDHSMVLSLAELVAVNSVTLCKCGEDPSHPVDSIVVCSRKPGPEGGFVVEAVDPDRDGDAIDTIVCALETSEAISDVTEHGVNRLVIPIQREHAAIGALMLEAEEPLDEVRSMVEGFARIYGNYIALLNESERDKLTGLYNRRSFEQRLQRLLKLHRQRSRPAPGRAEQRHAPETQAQLFLAILDIDHFKRINDTYGHVYGDEVILMLAQQMRTNFRQGDVLFRFGGEEFVMLLAAHDERTAYTALDRFRQYIASHAFPQVGHVTVSIGYARITENDYPEIVLDRADKALYFAKQNGRDAVHGYETLAQTGDLAPVALGSIDLF